jgi:hypothetical protein
MGTALQVLADRTSVVMKKISRLAQAIGDITHAGGVIQE